MEKPRDIHMVKEPDARSKETTCRPTTVVEQRIWNCARSEEADEGEGVLAGGRGEW